MHIALYPLTAVILFAANAIIPQVGIVAAVFSPLVLLLYLSHPERSKQYDILLALLIGGIAVLSPIVAGFFIISPLFSSFFVRYTIRNKMQESWLPIAGSAALTFAVAFVVIYTFDSYREDLAEFTANAMQTFINAAKEANAPMIQSPYFIQIEQNLNKTALALVLIFPAFNYMYSVFSAYVSVNLFAKIKQKELAVFRLPDNAVWILIVSFGFIFVPFFYGRFIGMNLSLIFLVLYAFQGFEIIHYWLNRFKVMPLIKAIIYIFIFSEPPVILIISLVGLFSVWFNFYGKKEEEQES